MVASRELSFHTIDLTLDAQTAIDLAAEWRGLGIGSALHQYVVEFMRNGGVALAQLSVSPSNARALAYYRNYSWRDLGPRTDDASVRLLELSIDRSG